MRFERHGAFPARVERLAAFARALAHPARISIIQTLLRHEPLCCREIVARLPLAQPTVSQHLKALDEAGLLLHKEIGPRVEYRLDRSRLKSFCHTFQEVLETSAQNQTTQHPRS